MSKKGNTASAKGKADDKLAKVKGAQSINVRHILCTKFSKMEEAKKKIIEDGEPFDKVAREYSEDKARQGGLLGWKTRGSLDAEFEKVAYGLADSSVGRPVMGEVKTGFGYHLIMVEGRK